MKKLVAIGVVLAVALALVLSFTIPAAAGDGGTTVGTGVNVQGGTTTPPVVKCKWEQDTTTDLEDGDPTHATSGSQFLPPGTFQGTKCVQYWAIVTDDEGVGTITQVTADVWHPTGPPEEGSFKYQVIMTKQDKSTEALKLALIAKYEAARDAGLVTYQPGYTDADILFELDKCTADVWMGEECLHYHQPCGDYKVKVDAFADGQWASEGTKDLENHFTYVCVPKIEIDFSNVSYGNVSVCTEKWIPGDTTFGTADFPTVRNIGNTDVKITVHQGDMGFGKSGGQPPTSYQGSAPPVNINDNPASFTSNWNVVFDARLGSDSANGMYYDPDADPTGTPPVINEVTLPNKLPLCNTQELDFSIHVYKSVAGTHSGTMIIGCVETAFGP